jgi:pimeloyl-ACP methyl ester carboxylesterase
MIPNEGKDPMRTVGICEHCGNVEAIPTGSLPVGIILGGVKQGARSDDAHSRRGRLSVVIGAVAIISVMAVTVGFVATRQHHASEFAQSAGASPVDLATSTASSTVVNPPPKITDLASAENPVAVGTTTVTLTDPTRSTPARGDTPESSSRSLSVIIRYPTVGMPSADEIGDAPPLEPAPLVVFAHGFNSSTEVYAALLHDLAAAGYVVAAPEFPMSSSVYSGEPDESDIPEQARDISFIISELTGADAPAVVADMIEPGQVGVVGHSDGAVTALLAAYSPDYADPRIGAVAAISGDFDTFGGDWFSTPSAPLLAIHGEYDEINPFDSSELLVDSDPYPAMLVGVSGSSHLGAVTNPSNTTSVARLIADDFRWRLSGLETAHDAMLIDANSSPLYLAADHP